MVYSSPKRTKIYTNLLFWSCWSNGYINWRCFTLNFNFSFRGVFRILWSIYGRGFLRKLLGSTKLCHHSMPSTTSHHFVVTTNDHPRPAISSFPTPTTTYYIATTKQYIRQTIILTTTMRKQSWFRHYHRALHLWCCSSPRSASV